MSNKEKGKDLKLLFFDNLDSNKPTYNIVEVFFNKAVNIHQFRILKPDSNPHAKYKSMMSKTQKDIIYNFEIFGRNLKKIDDKFELIFKCENINKTNGETDNIFPLLEKFTTNHIIFRGKFEMITMCIYGTTCDNNENAMLMEQERTDVSLDKIRQKIEIKKNKHTEKGTFISKEEKNLIEKYPIEKLMGEEFKSLFDEETEENSKINRKTSNDEKFKEILYINKGNKNMIDKTKTGYIYYENDLKQIIDNLFNFYNLEDKKISEQIILQHHINFKNLFIILEILIERNKAHLEDDCVFNKKNLEIFLLIPNKIISIINESLKGLKSGETEMKFGLKLLKYISNYESFVEEFIKKGGMEKLYNIILNNNSFHHSSHGKKEFTSSLVLKALALENIYKLLTFNCAYEKLIEKIDKNNFQAKPFLIKEVCIEKISPENLNKDEEEKDKKGRERDRSRDRESRHKKHSKSRTYSRSSSDSYSRRSRSRSRSRSYDKNDSRSSYHHSKIYRREKFEDITLNNGLQILGTLLIGKKDILLKNIMKNITKKINLIQYLKNFNDLINDYISSNYKKTYYLKRIQFYLHRIVTLLQKLDTPFLRNSSSSNQKISQNKLDDDYPFKHYWIDYFDMNKKYFNKDILNDPLNNNASEKNNLNNTEENENEEYIIRNVKNKYNEKYENIILTNEISELLEQYDFFNDLIILLSCEQIQSTSDFYSLGVQIKEVLSLICLNIGGINYLSKNYEKTSILIDLIQKIIPKMQKDFPDYCFKKIKINNYLNNTGDKNEIINDKFSQILIPSQIIQNYDNIDDLYLQINFLQIYYLLDYLNKYIHLFDELNYLLSSTKSDSDIYDFRQKIFNILNQTHNFYNKSELGKQGFLILLNNKYFIQIFINIIEFISDVSEDILDYEAHILLIIKLMYQIVISTNDNTSIFIILNKKIYPVLKKLNTNINKFLENKDSITLDNKLINALNGLISLLKVLENSSISNLMTNLKENIYNNILKYNLNEKITTEDEKYKRYYEEYKLLINKYNNDDTNFLGDIYKNDSLINSLYLSIKLLDINFKINPILLIEGEEGQLSMVLKYLIINSVNSFDYLIKKQMYHDDEGNVELELVNIMLNEENNFNCNYNNNSLVNKKIWKIPEESNNILIISNFLYFLYDILSNLLNNLLSSHVDNFRNEEIIDKLLLNISTCFNFLISFYSLQRKDFKIGEFLYKKINSVQNLFNKCLEVLHELCQFNTTIILKFKDIIERILSKPEDILCKLFLINFIMNNNNNEFTIDHFIDILKQSPEKINLNLVNTKGNNNINFEESLMNERLENLKFQELSLKTIISHCDQKINNFIDYIIIQGIITNDDFLKHQCAFILLSIFHKFTLKGNTDTFREIVSKIISEIQSQYDILSKVNCLIFEEKDYDVYIPNIRNLLNCIKFINILISKDVKFLFIFHDVAIVYMNIFKYVKNYIINKWEIIRKNMNIEEKNDKVKLLSNYIYDITLVTLEGFKFLFDNKRNFEDRYFFKNNIKYDLSEELPNTKQIVDILIEFNHFISVFKSVIPISINLVDKKKNKNNILINDCNRVIFLGNKILEILLNLSTNIYGQNLLMENISLIQIISELKNLKKSYMNKYLSSVIISLIKLTLVLFYDLDYYYISSKKKSESIEKFVISQQRLSNLSKMFLSEIPENNCDKLIPSLYEYNNLLINLIKNNNEEPALINIQNLQSILVDYKTTINVISLEKNKFVLPKMRDIQEKFEFIHVYNYFKQIQGVGNECKLEINEDGKVTNINFNDIISTLNGTANGMAIITQKINNWNNEYNHSVINEFDKLLNWKKARIYFNGYDSLKIRDINFNIDSYEFNINESLANCEFNFYQLKKNYLYNTNDSFEQYCNLIEYNVNIVNQFKNLSAFVFDTLCTKRYLFDSKEKHLNEILELFFIECQNEAINLEAMHRLESEIKKHKNIKENTNSSHNIKKKIKSKINKFIYKQRYDKQQNNNMTNLQILMKQQELQKYKVFGRNLSTHVDSVNPDKKIVNITYNNYTNTGVVPSQTPIVPNNLNLSNNNNSNLVINNSINNPIIPGENTPLPNIQTQNEPNFNAMNNQNNLINKNTNLITSAGDNRQNMNINPINNINNVPNPMNSMINLTPQNNMINLTTPNQKNPLSMNALLSNLKTPPNNTPNQIPIMPNSPMNLQDRKPGLNLNSLQGIPQNNINQLNFGNMTNPNMVQNLQQNKTIIPQNNNPMNYINQMSNPILNIPNINQMIPGTGNQNYQNLQTQMNNIGINPMNQNIANNNNNNQFGLNMNPNIIPQMNPSTNVPNQLSHMDSGNLNNNNNYESRKQNKPNNNNNLLNDLQKILLNINSSKNNSAAKDPRKNKKK